MIRSLIFAVCLLTACVAGPRVRVAIEVPAAVPVRTFPRVFLASRGAPSGDRLVSVLIDHLGSTEGLRVERSTFDDLERARLARALPVASVVVVLDLRFVRSSETRSTSRPETLCGPGGCFTRQRQDLYEVPQLRGELVLSVYDGPSSRLLQRVQAQSSAEGRPMEGMRSLVMDGLEARVRDWVDARVEALDVQLMSVELAGAETAVRHAQTGRWHEARVEYEGMLETPAFLRASSDEQAALLYNLGMSRRFDAQTLAADEAQHFADAESAFQRAIRLDPRPLYAAALAATRAQYRDRLLLARQREASQHNFALDERAPVDEVIPQPPPGY